MSEVKSEIREPGKTPERGHNPGGLVRLMTCGSVDDGKSTLIGRLLFEQNKVFDDQLDAVTRDSRRFGTTGDEVDLALLVDGLEAEREQGITIDVAYRFFSTPRRHYIIADAPGHEQYTRNMATAASVSDVAVLLIDARKGVLAQTRRHAIISSLFGISRVVLAVNKMDLVGYQAETFDRIAEDFAAFAAPLGFSSVTPIPISARRGDNVVSQSANMDWYGGPTLLGHMDGIDTTTDLQSRDMRFIVQWVNRPDADFRGYSGIVTSGVVRPGDEVVVAGSGRASKVERIVTMDGDLDSAATGASVTLTLADEIDISRGDVVAPAGAAPQVSDQFAVDLLWLDAEAMQPGRPYVMKIAAKSVRATITTLKHRTDVNTLAHDAARELNFNEMGVANISLSEPVAFDPFADNRDTGAFILIDRYSNATVGAGMIRFALDRASNVHWQALDIDKQARAHAMGQNPVVLWFTGLSGSGKSTIANIVEQKLHLDGRHTYLLDGDNVRHGLNRDLGFTDTDRVENIRRVAEVSRLFADAGLIVLVSFISPFRDERRMARELMQEGEFVEVFVDAPVEVCQERDPKGLYARALKGEIRNFTGIDSPYEPPEGAEIRIDTTALEAEAAAQRIIAYLKDRGVV
ncbi:MAG: sulfate adenylyltransferase subunit CysN [Rhizobiales bacterium]|nr:sulfate adenylyltransferase subunit CysN [Hyphomicrobiales bacterium]